MTERELELEEREFWTWVEDQCSQYEITVDYFLEEFFID